MGEPDPLGAIEPLAVPASASGVVIFGGVFDPPHRAHVDLGIAAREAVFPGGGWLVLVPAACSPLKPGGAIAGGAERVEMLRLAFGGRPRVLVWGDEIARAGRGGGASYTVDTVRRARRVLAAGVPIRLLIGADQAAAFHRWREPRAILAAAAPIVMLRGPEESAAVLEAALRGAGFWSDAEIAAWMSWVVPLERRTESSTRARELIRRGDPTNELPGLLDPAVLRFIRERGLYRGG